jgi:hypothetical protein
VTGERNTYVTSDEAHRYALARAAYGHEGAPRPALAVQLGVLVPEGMVAVNPDDARAAALRLRGYPPDWPAIDRFCDAVLAASNPTTETKP